MPDTTHPRTVTGAREGSVRRAAHNSPAGEPRAPLNHAVLVRYATPTDSL